MRSYFLSIAVLMAVSPAQAQVAAKGTVFVDGRTFPAEPRPEYLQKRVGVEIPRLPDETWDVHFFARFGQPSKKGWMTVAVYNEDGELMFSESLWEGAGPSYQNSFLLHDGLGFQPGQSYRIIVGQILGSKLEVYAKGDFRLAHRK